MQNCIFCSNKLTLATKLEHVLLNAFGGRLSSRKLICTPCNERFGSTIDRTLAEQFAEVRNLFRLKSGSGNEAPALKGLLSHGQKIDLLGDGGIKFSGKPFTVEKIAEGAHNVRIQAASEASFRKILPNIASKIGISKTALSEQLKNAGGTIINRRPNVTFEPSFGGADALRSVMKTALELWAHKMGNTEVLSSAFDDSRAFVLNGGDDFSSHRMVFDARPLPDIERMKELYGPLFNLIYLRSDGRGRVIGHVTFYNLVAWQMVLAEESGMADKSCGLISNPLAPAQWSSKTGIIFDIDFDWLAKPDCPADMTQAKARFVAMNKYYLESQTPQAIADIVDQCAQRLGYAPDQALNPEQAAHLRAYASHRICYHGMGLPFEEHLSPADMARILDEPSS